MSTLGGNCISDFWSMTWYVGNRYIFNTMPRDRFSDIDRCVRIYPDKHTIPDIYDQKHNDPLWATRPLLNSFLSKSTSIGVPTGEFSLDEANMHSKSKS